jgi:hypothetical protein
MHGFLVAVLLAARINMVKFIKKNNAHKLQIAVLKKLEDKAYAKSASPWTCRSESKILPNRHYSDKLGNMLNLFF